MKKTNLVNKFSCFLVICVFLLTTPITLATTTSINANPDNNETISITGDDTYAGYMSIHSGDILNGYSPDLNIDINKDFGGVDKTIHVPHGGTLTFTAKCKIRCDSALFSEYWDFFLELFGHGEPGTCDWYLWGDWTESDYPGSDESGSKTISIDWTPDPREDKWLKGGVGKFWAKLTCSYNRWPDLNLPKEKSGKTDKVTIILDNDPPNTPAKPTGPSSFDPGEKGNFGTSTTDPNGDRIEYGWDWDGDKIVDEWMESVESGKYVSKSHVWDAQGTYNIRVKARDTYLPEAKAESGWSEPKEISVTKARSKDNTITNPYLKTLLEKWNFNFLKLIK